MYKRLFLGLITAVLTITGLTGCGSAGGITREEVRNIVQQEMSQQPASYETRIAALETELENAEKTIAELEKYLWGSGVQPASYRDLTSRMDDLEDEIDTFPDGYDISRAMGQTMIYLDSVADYFKDIDTYLTNVDTFLRWENSWTESPYTPPVNHSSPPAWNSDEWHQFKVLY